MDVLQVVTSRDRRGAEVFAVELDAALRARGLDVQTVALTPGPAGTELAIPALGRRPLGLRTLARLRRAARPAALVVAHGSRTLPACALALAGSRTPFVYRNIGDPRFWAATPLRRIRTRLLLRRARAVVALTEESATELVARKSVAPDRIVVIPRGVRAARFRPATTDERAAARGALGLPIDAPVAVSLGSLSPEKGVETAIDAVAALAGVHLLVAGDGPERSALEARAGRLLADRAHFAGSLADPTVALAAADVLLLSSRTEGLPGVAIEAGLSAVPVVATDVGYVRAIVVDGVTGAIVAPGDVAAMAAAAARVLRQPQALGEAARRRCRELFDLEVVADAWARVIRGLLENGMLPTRAGPAPRAGDPRR